MHSEHLDQWQHDHDFHRPVEHGERNTRRVMVLTLVMMVIEIVFGILTGSMALLADGWHMATHVAAFGITAFAYAYARRHAGNKRFTFGTGKVGDLGGYTSAVVLALIAVYMAWESAQRLWHPVSIRFDEAILVAVAGLAVNLISAWLLKDHHHHDHGHHHDHEHKGHADHNLRAAYLHVLADALTSVTAIVALVGGKYFGWNWLDPMMGIVGSLVISVWAYGLLRNTSEVLLDGLTAPHLDEEIREALQQDDDTCIADLHVWQVGTGKFSAIVSVVAHDPKPPEHYKRLLRVHEELVHLTIEVNHCEEEANHAA
jgi:cation diffusion facilitator family transporter